MLFMQLYFTRKTMTIIEEQPRYLFQSLMSSLGGTISLYLGVSIVSAFEIVELTVRLIFGIGLWADRGRMGG